MRNSVKLRKYKINVLLQNNRFSVVQNAIVYTCNIVFENNDLNSLLYI